MKEKERETIIECLIGIGFVLELILVSYVYVNISKILSIILLVLSIITTIIVFREVNEIYR